MINLLLMYVMSINYTYVAMHVIAIRIRTFEMGTH